MVEVRDPGCQSHQPCRAHQYTKYRSDFWVDRHSMSGHWVPSHDHGLEGSFAITSKLCNSAKLKNGLSMVLMVLLTLHSRLSAGVAFFFWGLH